MEEPTCKRGGGQEWNHFSIISGDFAVIMVEK
jgi:hypothetical protein